MPVQLANVLFIEAPVGVGFSYATDPQRYHIGDTGTAIDNYRLLQGTGTQNINYVYVLRYMRREGT